MDFDDYGTLNIERCSIWLGNPDTVYAFFYYSTLLVFARKLLRPTVRFETFHVQIVPLIAQKVLDGIFWLVSTAYNFITSLDDYTTWDEAAVLTLEGGATWTARHIPGPLMQLYTKYSGYLHVSDPLWQVYDKIGDALAMIPASVWNTVPLTLMSTVLGILVVPWIIFKIDDFFGYLADRQRSKIEV